MDIEDATNYVTNLLGSSLKKTCITETNLYDARLALEV